MDKRETEGEKLERLLTDRGLKVADLARAAGKSWPAAKKWIAAEEIGVEARESVVKGLDALGIDPRLMWPPDQREGLDDLKSLLGGMDDDMLRKVRILLMASRANQIRLIDNIDGRLERGSLQQAR